MNKKLLSDEAMDGLVRQALAREADAAVRPGLSLKIADTAMQTAQEPVWSRTPQQVQPTRTRSWAWPVLWPSMAGVAASAMLGFFAGTGQLPVTNITEPLGLNLAQLTVVEDDPWADVEVMSGLTGGFVTDFSGGLADDGFGAGDNG
jgi:hypothetical protein